MRAAANTDGGAPPASTTTPAPAIPAPSAAEITAATEVPTTLAEPTRSRAATATTATSTPTATAADPGGSPTVLDTDVRTTDGRQVTWPVALAATMLLGVVAAVGVHVGGAKVRSSLAAADRRTSLLDVWELALAG